MAQYSLVQDVTWRLNHDPKIRSRVGNRVQTGTHSQQLPHIVVDEIASAERGKEIVLICRAKTLREADRVGSAVVTALKGKLSSSRGVRFVTIQDRSSYDSASKAFRRVIQLKAEPEARFSNADR